MESNSRAESRFSFYHSYFYIGGVPLFNTAPSILYHVFALFCYLCGYSTILAMFIDLYHHIEDLDDVMDAALLLILFYSASCTQLYFR
jgi:hypothetical protein